MKRAILIALIAVPCGADELDHFIATIRVMNDAWHLTCINAASTNGENPSGVKLCNDIYAGYVKALR